MKNFQSYQTGRLLGLYTEQNRREGGRLRSSGVLATRVKKSKKTYRRGRPYSGSNDSHSD